MHTMKKVCQMTNLSYETLKFYCNEGLVPNHRRNTLNHRVFSDKDVAWIKGLIALRNCGMSVLDMKQYMHYCQAGQGTIPARQVMLEITQTELLKQQARLQEALDYIEDKQKYYEDILTGKIAYTSNLE